MGISPKLLGEGEHVIVSTRTHWKALVIPVIVLILVCGVAGFLVAIRPSGGAEKPVRWAPASEEGQSVLYDVPNVEDLQLVITNLLFSTDDGADDDGTPPRSPEPRRR